MENLFIIFAPGCAGNHLANIVSTSYRFSKRYTDDVYNNTSINAHVAENKNYEINNIEFVSIQNQSNLFCSHLAEYLIAHKKTKQYLQNRKYIVVEFPEQFRNSFFTNRISHLYPAYQDAYFIDELSVLYSTQYFSRLTDERNTTNISVDKIFTEDVVPLVAKLNSELGLNLAADAVEKIHSSWIEKNKRFL